MYNFIIPCCPSHVIVPKYCHVGASLVEKYTSRLRDVLRGAFLGGFGGMAPRENFFKWCNLVCVGVYLDQISSLKNF